jgi:uncharacterized protein YeaO (DUF488 family)
MQISPVAQTSETQLHALAPQPLRTAPVQVKIDPDRVLRLNGDKLYPFDPGVSEVDLVIFWPGQGYGTQRLVLEHERYGVGPALAAAGIAPGESSEVLVLVVKQSRRPWKKVARTIARLESEHGIRVRSKVLGCWSGGSSGSSTALNADEHFVGWFMADPSPAVARRRSWPRGVPKARLDVLRVWRNVDNWGHLAGPGGFYRRDISHFLERVSDLGGEMIENKRNHKELLLMGLTAAIEAVDSQRSLSRYDVQTAGVEPAG